MEKFKFTYDELLQALVLAENSPVVDVGEHGTEFIEVPKDVVILLIQELLETHGH